MSVALGVKLGSNPGQLAGVDPRLIAGGAREDGGRRVRSPGAQTSGGGHPRGAGALPHPVQQAAAARVARVECGVDLSGGRSSGALENGAVVAVEWRA